MRTKNAITRRDYFAVHAPAEIPEWFKGPTLPRPAPPAKPACILAAVDAWLADSAGCDLIAFVDDDPTPERERAAEQFQADWEAYSRARAEVRQAETEARYVGWRVWYGNKMAEAMA